MKPPDNRKEVLIALSGAQRTRLFAEASALKVEVQAISKRAEHYTIIALTTVGVAFTLWLALRPRKTR